MSVSAVHHVSTVPAAAHLSPRVRTGLVLCCLIGLTTVPALFIHPAGNDGPPAGGDVVVLLLGLIAVVGAVVFWRTGKRLANRLAAGALILNAIQTLPSFFVDFAAWVKVIAAVIVLLTVVAVVLQLSRPKSTGIA